MIRKIISSLISITAITAVLLYTGCSRTEVNAYSKFGFSFDYPADMVVVEGDVTYFGEEANEKAGVLNIGKPEVFLDIIIGKPGVFLEVFWAPAEDADSNIVLKTLKDCLARRKGVVQSFKDAAEKYQVTSDGKKLTFERFGRRFYQGKVTVSKQGGRKLLQCRFYTEGAEGHLLSIAGAWYCHISKRIFIVTSSARWMEAGIESNGTRWRPTWPKLKHDPSCSTYKIVLSSFKSFT